MTEKYSNLTPQDNRFKGNEKISLNIEIAKEGDWKDYKKIWLEAIEKEPLAYWATKDIKEKTQNKTEEEWKSELKDPNSFTFLSKKDDVPVGITQALLKNKNENRWAIRRVYLNKDFRGSGNGEKIVVSVLDEIKKRGGEEAYLNVADTQKEAQKLYEKLGFRSYDIFLSETIDNIEYPPEGLLEEETKLNDGLVKLQNEEQSSDVAMHETMKDIYKLSELIKDVIPYYDFAKPHEKEKIVRIIFSELYVSQNTLKYKCKKGFECFENRFNAICDPTGNRTRITGLKSRCPNR